ncbi:MAG: hypothetical protein JWM14_2860 [Chitinophagaceae bacterium]|nr:hypothetical protein [Chitinophagaceae bacterium]
MKKASIFLMALLCVFSCTKKKEDQDPSPAVNPYFHPEAGNYWVYKSYKIDSFSTQELPGMDIVTVSGDTLIQGKRYAVFSGTQSPFYSQWRVMDILRDSSGCIVDQNGVIRFSSANNIGDTLSTSYIFTGNENQRDTFIVFKWFMAASPRSIHVPAGFFTVLNGMCKLTEIHNGGVTINYSHCYAAGVGLVMSQDSWEYQMKQGIYYERRLVSYHVVSQTP